MLRRQNHRIVNRCGVVLSKLSYSDSALVQPQLRIKDLVTDNCLRTKTKFQEHFIENLFLNKFQRTLLEYPEIESIKEITALKKQCKLAQKYLNQPTDGELVCPSNPDQVVAALKKFELSGFKSPVTKNGYGYLNSEYLYMLETLSSNLSLCRTISQNEDFGTELISFFGSSSQKEKYLSKLTKGESIACFAHSESEPLVSLDPISLKTTAVMTSDGQSYIVNGKKDWVYNATYADIIIFSANITSTNLEGELKTSPTLFVVDKNLSGIKIHEPNRNIGLSGVDVCEVTFDSVVIPSVCVLGEINKGSDIIKKGLIKEKLSHGAQSVTIMRKLINIAINHCLHTKYIKKYKSDRQYFKSQIGNLVSRVYSAESMTYLIAGRLDMFHDADVFLESLILKIFTSENLHHILQQTLTLLGTDGFSNYDEVEELIKESQYYIHSGDRNDHLKLVLSTAGCKHVMRYKKERTAFQRFVGMFDKQDLMYLVGAGYPLSINPVGTISEYLHLMFEEESKILEDCLFHLKLQVGLLLKEYGEAVFDCHIELKLLADLVIHIYAMTATLGRASRAYCLCVRNFESDRIINWSEMNRLYFLFHETRTLLEQHVKSPHWRELNLQILNQENYLRRHSVAQSFLAQNKVRKSSRN